MLTPIALQLYTVRDALAKDFPGVVRKVADMGYVGVETAGFYGGSPQAAARLFNEVGLTVPSAHLPLPLGEKKNEVLDMAAALGCKRIVLGGTPRGLRTADQVKRACDTFNAANAVAREHGLTLAIHNHWWEFERLDDGGTMLQVMQANLEPNVLFELDVYWAKTGGADPAGVVNELGPRAPLLHIKDGPCLVGQPMTALGEGRVDIPSVVHAGAGTAEWLIVELDECATDMPEAVRRSYRYLIDKGLARGNKN
jgi:sugar phosphate isomerase/epimerase